jgi:AAA+ ATPase superfamily predicted ATPase
MQNIVGQIASKTNFYMREKEIRRIKMNLNAGANIQIAAPRRVGKSSILYYFLDNPEKGFIHIYLQVESARSKNDFYRKLYKEIIKSEAVGSGKRFFDQLKSTGNFFLSKLKGVKIGGSGIDFHDAEDIDYEEELSNLLLGLDLDGDRLILMVDEFPEVILNIVEENKGDIVEAKKFLQSNRELRNNAKLNNKVQFIYTGSNSLNLTVGNLDSSSLINDLAAVPVSPLSKDEARDLIQSIMSTYKYNISGEIVDYIIEQVEWTIPFYFQLVIHEVLNDANPGDEITTDIIDRALKSALEQRNDHHFEHYVKRLKRVFKPNEQQFIQKFLCVLCKNNTLDRNDAIDIATGVLTEDETRRLLEALKYDGYIINENNTNYKFTSPILKNWWHNHEC